MRKFFTLVAFTAISFFAHSQEPTTCIPATRSSCLIPVTNDFDASAEGFVGSGNNPLIAYNSAGGNFQVGGATSSNTAQNSSYIITSPNIEAAPVVNVGFTLGGSAILNTVTVDVLNSSGTTVLATCSFSNGQVESGSLCFSFTDLDLLNQVVKFRITLRTRNSNQGGVGTLTFDDFRVAFTELVVTPVNFVSFDAKSEGNGTKLTWKVANQIDVLRYDVERSSDGNNFTKIGEVTAADITTYNFTDKQPAQGTVYYRIKNVDIDGRFKFSTIVSIRNGNAAIVLKAFPLPAKNSVTLQHATANAKTIVRLSAQDGRTVQTLRPAVGTMQTSIDLSALAPGLYIVSFDNGNGQLETLKVVKQ